MKTLLVTQDFPPLVGGIANYYFNRVNKMPADDIIVLMNKVGNYQLLTRLPDGQVTNYQLYYRNFFTKIIWPHWLPLIWWVYKIVKTEKIQKIWVGQVLPVGSAVYIINKFLNIPYFVTCHGNDLLRAKSVSRKHKLARKILKTADYVEVNTEFTKNILIKDFDIAENKVKVIYPECALNKNMADMKKVEELREKYGLHNKKVLLTVARLAEPKGIDKVIQALPKVLEHPEYSGPDLVYMIVGDGEEKDNLVETRHALSLQDKIIFVGSVPHAELPNYYALADAFILTPHRMASGDTESYGIVYLEAKEFGLPIIAGDVGGVREINYNKMILVDSENIDKIAEKIVEVIK